MAIFEVYARTEAGVVRTVNEDHILVGRFIKNRGDFRLLFNADDDLLCEQGLLLAIADGIGGELGGATASRLALLTMEQQFYVVSKNHVVQGVKETILHALKEANATLLQTAKNNSTLTHMGCTIAGICLTSQGFLVFNSGDSRVYYYHSPILKLLTTDNTVTQIAVQGGRMTYAAARRSGQRHCLTNFLGYERFNCPIQQYPTLRSQDIVLICSDGLSDLVDDNQLEQLLGEESSYLPTLGQHLLQAAIANGGHDNISFILIRLDSTRSSL